MTFRATAIFGLAGLACALPADLDSAPLEKRLNNGVGVTPAMGWNNWNAFAGAGKPIVTFWLVYQAYSSFSRFKCKSCTCHGEFIYQPWSCQCGL